MMQFDLLTIQKNIEEKRLILGEKVTRFLLAKLQNIGNFFAALFAAKYFAVVSFVAVFCLSIFLQSIRDIGQDSALYLELAQKIFDGGKYYQDFFEVNLPLAYLITAIPLFFAKFFAISPIITTEIWVNLCGILAIYCSAKIVLRSEIAKDRTVFNLLIFAFSCGFFLRIFTLQFNEFATKATYFLVFFYPYFSYQLVTPSRLTRFDHIAAGILAALLICLKPHYAILVAAFEIRKIYHARSFKVAVSWQNFVTLFAVIFYVAFLFFYFPDYIRALPALAQLYLNPQNFYPFFPLREDIYPLILLIVLCYFLRKKFDFLAPLFFVALVFCVIVASELAGVYDQRVLLYSVSLPLVFLVILALIRDQQINWHRDFLTLLVILLIPQFDRSFFVTTAFNICAFWWIFVLAIMQKWRKFFDDKNIAQAGFLRFIFLPRDPLSWCCFGLLVTITIKLSSTRILNNLAWIFSAIIFVILVYFYHNLQRRFVSEKKFSLFSASMVFVVLSYFASLQIAAIFKNNDYKSPNFINDQIALITRKYSSKDENFIFISSRTLASYPLRSYLEKPNPLPTSQMQNLYFRLDDHFDDEVQKYFISRLKEQMQNQENKLLFVEPFGLPASDRCRVAFLDYYLRDAEFRKIFFENYRFLNRVMQVEKSEKKINFFSDSPDDQNRARPSSASDSEIITRDVEVYVRK